MYPYFIFGHDYVIVYMCVFMNTYVSLYICIYMHVYTYIMNAELSYLNEIIYVLMFMFNYICIYACIYIRLQPCVYLHIHGFILFSIFVLYHYHVVVIHVCMCTNKYIQEDMYAKRTDLIIRPPIRILLFNPSRILFLISHLLALIDFFTYYYRLRFVHTPFWLAHVGTNFISNLL